MRLFVDDVAAANNSFMCSAMCKFVRNVEQMEFGQCTRRDKFVLQAGDEQQRALDASNAFAAVPMAANKELWRGNRGNMCERPCDEEGERKT